MNYLPYLSGARQQVVSEDTERRCVLGWARKKKRDEREREKKD